MITIRFYYQNCKTNFWGYLFFYNFISFTLHIKLIFLLTFLSSSFSIRSIRASEGGSESADYCDSFLDPQHVLEVSTYNHRFFFSRTIIKKLRTQILLFFDKIMVCLNAAYSFKRYSYALLSIYFNLSIYYFLLLPWRNRYFWHL